ncbi:MAG: ABC transporter ATP-binding protein [Flavobacteriales bacterium]|nr:MAG: ABC transporter ATP-binding protein [Flavobacteriales bacterium]
MSNNYSNIIEVKDVSIGYSNKKDTFIVSKNINFSSKKSELISIVGTNGIGKSTLLKTLARIQPQKKGTILLNNKNFYDYSTLEIATQLSIVLTESPSSKNLTVKELVSLGRHPYTNWIGILTVIDEKIIEESLIDTDTLSLVNKKCSELSDGQLQRVMIARALVQDTPIILLDEPTTHLDIYHRAYILKLLKNLADKKKKTIIFSTHEIDLAIQVSHKMIVMTKEKTYFDKPEMLIKSGCFKNLFPSETIEFDNELKQFILKNNNVS